MLGCLNFFFIYIFVLIYFVFLCLGIVFYIIGRGLFLGNVKLLFNNNCIIVFFFINMGLIKFCMLFIVLNVLNFCFKNLCNVSNFVNLVGWWDSEINIFILWIFIMLVSWLFKWEIMLIWCFLFLILFILWYVKV